MSGTTEIEFKTAEEACYGLSHSSRDASADGVRKTKPLLKGLLSSNGKVALNTRTKAHYKGQAATSPFSPFLLG